MLLQLLHERTVILLPVSPQLLRARRCTPRARFSARGVSRRDRL